MEGVTSERAAARQSVREEGPQQGGKKGRKQDVRKGERFQPPAGWTVGKWSV